MLAAAPARPYASGPSTMVLLTLAAPLLLALPQDIPAPPPPPESPEARALWDSVVAAAFNGETDHRVLSFDFECEGQILSGGAQTNDFKARILYLEPGYVRREMKSGRTQMRGPEGDFYLAPEGRAVPLRGREFREDIKELDQTVSIARTFVSLSDPRRVRVESLALAEAPKTLPERLRERAGELSWIALRTPDFYLSSSKAREEVEREPLYRVHLGIDPASKLPELAVIQRDVLGAVDTAQLVELAQYATIDGHRVPHRVRTYTPEANTSPWVFGERPSSTLWLKRGTLKPELTPVSFVPKG